MTRNTHDRLLDHQNSDLESNIVLGTLIDRYPAGTTLTAVLTDLIARITANENKFHLYSFTANSTFKATTSSSFTIDALKISFKGSKTANAVVKKTQVSGFTIDAVKQ